MRITILSLLMLCFSLSILSAQSTESGSRLKLDVSARATAHTQLIVQEDDGFPASALEDAKAAISTYFGSAYQVGITYALNESLHLGVAADVQFTGFRSRSFENFTVTNPADEFNIRFIDQFLGLGVAFNLRQDINSRFYLRAGITPTWLTYRKSKTVIDPKDAIPGLEQESENPSISENLKSFNTLFNFGVGYGIPFGNNHRLYLEYGAEYYGRKLFNNNQLNRRIIGSALKVGLTL